MARRGDVPTRGEITEKVDRRHDDMNEKTDEMDQSVQDVETVRQTLESLDFAGTAEAAEAVEQSIQGAEDAGTDEFERRSDDLDGLQQESQEHEGDLQERSDGSSADLGRISDASGRLHSDAANNELVAAKEADLRDIEFLDEQLRSARDARQETEQREQEYRSRINAGKDS